jgi:hypothetical protein
MDKFRKMGKVDNSDVFTVSELRDKVLYVYGFIKLIITLDFPCIYDNDFEVKPESFQDVFSMVRSLKKTKSFCVPR